MFPASPDAVRMPFPGCCVSFRKLMFRVSAAAHAFPRRIRFFLFRARDFDWIDEESVFERDAC